MEKCKIHGCERETTAMGMCKTHYQQDYRKRNHSHSLINIKGCTVDDCQERHYSKGLCHRHYHEQLRNQVRLQKKVDELEQRLKQAEDEIHRFRMAANAAEKHISGTAKLFSHRNKTAVLDQLRRVLEPYNIDANESAQ